MMNNNKILTVSYGTFSCTLEGFDDSFGTMKAIAEYFRDLASDDRYFGAEPPQPDAEMLARIAQKEVSRRVEAREHEGKIVLSALDDSAALTAPVSPPSAEPSDAPVADQPLDMSESDDASEAQDRADEKTVVEEPAVEEAAAEETVVEDAAAQETAVEEPAQEDLIADARADHDGVEDAAQTAAAQADEVEARADDRLAEETLAADDTLAEDARDIVPDLPDADVEAFFEGARAEDDTALEDAEEAPAPAAPAPAAESIAAKLQRIRAVVAQHDDEDEDDDYSEDEHANGEAPAASAPAEEVVADARRDIEDALQADENTDLEAAIDNAAEEGVADEEIDDIADILRRLEGGDTSDLEKGAQDTAPVAQDPVAKDASDTLSDDISDVLSDDGIALSNVFEDDTVAAQDPAPEGEEVPVASKIVASEGLRVETTQAAAPRRPNAPRARVIKVKRADLEAAIEQGELEEYDDEEDINTAQAPAAADAAKAPVALDDLAPSKTAGSSLSPEEEDELARELAALEADMQGGQDAFEDEDDTYDDMSSAPEDTIAATLAKVQDDAPSAPKAERPAERAPAAARAKLPSIDEGQDTDVSRLLAEADSQMDEPESATRRDAFAHLRAAVAAKKADQALGRNDDNKNDDAYRNDLADVVRPRRPASGEARTKRPGDGRPAPLKLVAEQRIDLSQQSKPAGPVSPRRVAKSAAPAEAADGSFVDFAQEMGATGLPDLLEAAAAYLSFVEGHDNFSRPQLMSKVRQAGPEGFSREDTLRSFGKLLREGKIEKIRAGQFSASDDIGFHPGRRAAG